MAKTRGRPMIALRLDPWEISALKISASRHGKTVSDLLRDLIAQQLREDGITAQPKPIEGQISM